MVLRVLVLFFLPRFRHLPANAREGAGKNNRPLPLGEWLCQAKPGFAYKRGGFAFAFKKFFCWVDLKRGWLVAKIYSYFILFFVS